MHSVSAAVNDKRSQMDGEHVEKYSSYALTSEHARCMLPHEENWLFLLPKNLRKPSKQCEKHALSEIGDQTFPECLAVFRTEILHGNCSLPGNVWSPRLPWPCSRYTSKKGAAAYKPRDQASAETKILVMYSFYRACASPQRSGTVPCRRMYKLQVLS